ncbi:MAG: hypothetical protein ACW99J_16730 [Candidatus Thorarchaeota archaeon]
MAAMSVCLTITLVGNYWHDYDGSGTYVLPDGSLEEDHYPGIFSDSAPPVVDSPPDAGYHWAEREHSWQWQPSDQYPYRCKLIENGMDDDWRVWERTSPVTVLVDDLSPGLHNFTLILEDVTGSRTIDTVLVDVLPDDNGLEWAIQTNQTMRFTLTASIVIGDNHTSVSKDVEIEIIEFEAIPSPKSDHIPFAYGRAYEHPGRVRFDLSDYFDVGNILLAVLSPAVAIGNWSMLSTFAESEWGATVIEDDSRWGMRFLGQEDEFTLDSDSTWFKSDGTLEHVLMNLTTPAGQAISELTRVDVPGGFADILIVLPIVVGAFGIAVVVLILRKRR